MGKASKEELDRLGRAWYEAEPEERLRLAGEIFLLAYELFDRPAAGLRMKCEPPKYADALGMFYEQDFQVYDPNARALYSFMAERLKKRVIDMVHADREDHKPVLEDGNRGWVSSKSFDEPVGEDGEATLGDLTPDERPKASVENEVFCHDSAVRLISLMLSLPERLTGRAKNPTRLNYFRMFFTDGMVDSLHQGLGVGPFTAHERELFSGAVKTEFLDFFMAAICRRVREICACPVKPYGKLVEGRPMEEPGHPLPIDVYLTYLNTCEGRAVKSAGTISTQRGEYETFMRNSLCS